MIPEDLDSGKGRGRFEPGLTYAALMAVVQWLSDEEQRVWRQLLSVHARLLARLDEELNAAQGMSLGDYEVLVHLSEAPGRALRMAELANLLSLSPSGLTRRVDGLVRAGLVMRRPCPSDGRGSLAVLTDAGWERVASAAATHVAGVRTYLFDPLAGPALDALAKGLAGIEDALAGGHPGGQRGDIPVATSPPRSTQPFVPPATETAE